MMKHIIKKALLPLLLGCMYQSAGASVVINEAMPCNLNTYMDMGTYEYSPWVELYNNGKDTINLNGYTFVYEPTEETTVKEHTIDYDYKLAGGKYVLFYFDKVAGKSRHISFKLDADGGSLSLQDASGNVVSSLTVPDICTYVSFGVNGKSTGYMEPTPGAANDTAYAANTLAAFQSKQQCATPTFSKTGGVYKDAESINITISCATADAKIYYTTDGTVPTKENGELYSKALEFSKTTVIRARAYVKGKVSSPIATASYLFNDKSHSYCDGVGKLPIVSIVTDIKNFKDKTIGMAVKGENGVKGKCGSLGSANYNHDWHRPMNFEFIENGKTVVSHELEAKVMGGCSRQYDTKSLALIANKKCGSGKNKMKYAFFTDKPDNVKYKSLHLRNGGNDYDGLRFRDGFMQSIIHGENIDYQAYRPVGYYLNGEYQGLMLLNEHVNEDYVYTNYGIDDEDVDLIKISLNKINVSCGTVDAYDNLINEAQIGQNTSGYYEKMNKLMDIDEYITYMVYEQYLVNTDWPSNNLKIWRHKNNGRFRWIVYDTDFGFGLYAGYSPNFTTYTTDMIKFAAGEGSAVNWGNGSSSSPYSFTSESKWKTILFSSLMKNEEFRNKFMTRNLMLLATRFKPETVKAKLDSIAHDAFPEYCAMTANEHWKPDFADNDEMKTMKEFAEKRPSYVLEHLADYYGGNQVNLSITSNIEGTDWIINGLYWDKDKYDGKYVSNQPLTVTAMAPAGYTFKNWKLSSASSSKLITKNHEWDYLYTEEGAAKGWKESGFSAESWLKGSGKFGFGPNDDYDTEIDYGPDSEDKPVTAYFRTTVDIDDLTNYEKFSVNIAYDDAYIIYINGTEVSRDNLSEESVTNTTLADDYTNDAQKELSIASKYFKEGENTIAVEIHQNTKSSGDLTFAMTLNAIGKSTGITSTHKTYTTTINDDYSMEAVFEKATVEPLIYINEICSSNQPSVQNSEVQDGYVLGYADEYGKYGDWIELYNASDEDKNIAGWYITDNASKPTKYRIPTTDMSATIVPAHGYKMIWCDNDIWNGPMHVDFKLGDTKINSIVLSSSPKTIVDSLTAIMNIGTNQSYGREVDGNGKTRHFINNCKTPMAANGSLTGCATTELNIEAQKPNTIALYPNPVDDQLNIISTGEAIKMVRIYDNLGRAISANSFNTKEASLDTNYLGKGIYQLSVETESNTVHLKFIKK